jgi:hypothetical protein
MGVNNLRDAFGGMGCSNVAVSLRSRARRGSPHSWIVGAPSIGRLEAITRAIEAGVRRYAKGDRFAILMAAHIVVASKR